jgi:hypothetical protein
MEKQMRDEASMERRTLTVEEAGQIREVLRPSESSIARGDKAMSEASWTTRLPQEYTRAYGVIEAHCVCFQPADDQGGIRGAATFCIPETPEELIEEVLRQSDRRRIAFFCDTANQAEQIAVYAAARLPNHRRVALERAVAGEWGARRN